MAQVANFALQAALTELLAYFGLHPDAVLGHSVGEVASFWAAGALSLEDAVQVAFHRGRLQATTAGEGGMLAVEMGPDAVATLLREYNDEATIAAINGATAVTIAGPQDVLTGLSARLTRANVFNRALQVEVPYHSRAMDRLLPELTQCLSGLRPAAPQLPLFSTVTGARMRGRRRRLLVPQHARRRALRPRHARRHHRGLHHLRRGRAAPRPHHLRARRAAPGRRRRRGLRDPHPQKPEVRSLVSVLCRLHVAGVAVDWDKVFGGPRAFADLPKYPWQRERHWTESSQARARRVGASSHPLLGRRLDALQPRWEASLGDHFIPWAVDHRVDGEVLLPGAAFCEAAIASTCTLFPDDQVTVLEDLVLQKALILGRGRQVLHQSFDRDGLVSFHSRSHEEGAPWTPHATVHHRSSTSSPRVHVNLTELRTRFFGGERVEDFYGGLEARGYGYGPSFRHVVNCWKLGDECFAELQVEPHPALDLSDYHFHPAVLDACLHPALMTLPDDGRTYLPVRIKRLVYRARATEQLFVHVQSKMRDDTVVCELRIYDARGEVLLELDGVESKALNATQLRSQARIEDWLWTDVWEEQARPRPREPRARFAVLDPYAALPDLRTRLHGSILSADAPLLPQIEAIVAGPGVDEVVFVWAPGFDAEEGGIEHGTEGCAILTRLTQALAQAPLRLKLTVVTRGAQTVDGDDANDPGAAMLWSFGRVVRNEHARQECTLVDLPVDPEVDDVLRWSPSCGPTPRTRSACCGPADAWSAASRPTTPSGSRSRRCAPATPIASRSRSSAPTVPRARPGRSGGRRGIARAKARCASAWRPSGWSSWASPRSAASAPAPSMRSARGSTSCGSATRWSRTRRR
ncbi:MAG: polyketide synthase dehydratase domain-containing protein [Myxococcota bacterium]